jgi:aspartate racemase
MSIDGHKVVGIIGGMGPEATVDLMHRVVAATPAHDDADHIHLIVDSNPKVPSRIAALIEGRTDVDPAPAIAGMARRLEQAGADALAMACNTAHWYAGSITDAVSIPLLHMIELTADEIARHACRHKRAGLLASTAVHNIGLYETALAARGVEVIIPADQDELLSLIRTVKAGDTGAQVRAQYANIARQLAASRVDVLAVACTELSVLASSLEAEVPVIDALDVLTRAIVEFAN